MWRSQRIEWKPGFKLCLYFVVVLGLFCFSKKKLQQGAAKDI